MNVLHAVACEHFPKHFNLRPGASDEELVEADLMVTNGETKLPLMTIGD